ncbi:MAG: type II secretion system F family protein [Ilumatobacteraceae bacterium]|nr:type II secretion system F family protein [Ilumatobacteraceae bacterium]
MTFAISLLGASLGSISAALVVVLLLLRVRPRPQRIGLPAQPAGNPLDLFERLFKAARGRREARQPVPAAAVALWCDDLGRCLRSGSTLRDALMVSIPSTNALRAASDPLRLALDRGKSIPEAVAMAAGGSPDRHDGGTHADLAFTMIAISARLGGSNAAALDRVGASLRLRAADQQERVAHGAQARLSAHVLTVVPLAMLGMLMTTDADVRAVVTTPIGVACIGGGLLLNLTGWMWMRRVIEARR